MIKKDDNKSIHKQVPDNEKSSSPITSNEEIPQNPDPHIDQDFPGYPHSPSKNTNIQPQTMQDKLVAGTVKKSGTGKKREKSSQPELDSDGSANAFERTELSEQPEEKKKDNPENPSY